MRYKKHLAPLTVCLFAEKQQPSKKDDIADSEKKWWINCWGYEPVKSTLGASLYGALITTMRGLSLT